MTKVTISKIKAFKEDFQDGVISLASFNDEVPVTYQYEMNQAITIQSLVYFLHCSLSAKLQLAKKKMLH